MSSRRLEIARQTGRWTLGLGRPPARAIGRADQRLLRLLRTRGHSPAAERAMRLLGSSAEHGVVWAGIGLTGAALDAGRRSRWLRGAAVGPLAGVFNGLVKIAIGRQRPVITEHPALAKAPTKLSFPSSHSTSSTAAAIALGRVQPKARPGLYVLAATLCVGRPYLGMHYPSDVVAGVALGALIGRIVPGLDGPSVEQRLEALRVETREVREERIEDDEAEGDAALERSAGSGTPAADPAASAGTEDLA